MRKRRRKDAALAFALDVKQPDPHAFIQWKGTDVCMDFHCECGAHHHIDADFVYAVKCYKCNAIWEMPSHLYPRRVLKHDCIFITKPEEE